MDFDPNEEQSLLADSLGRLLGDRYDFATRGRYLTEPYGWSRDMWRRYADLGLLALPFAEADGGLGGGGAETLIVMEALGAALTAEPYLATVLLGGGLIAAVGAPELRARALPRVMAGDLLLAFGQAERQSGHDLFDVATTARRSGDGWVLDGAKTLVIHGDCADRLVVSARVSGQRRDREGIGLFLVDAAAPGLSRRGYRTQDRLRAADIVLSGVEVSAHAAIGEPGEALEAIERVVDTALAALCAEAVGAMARALDITVDYLKTRSQFGKPIGGFQVLQHRAVDMLVSVEQARSMALAAALAGDGGDPLERRRLVSAAKVQIGQAGRFVGEQAIQLHGGIGLTEDCCIGHYHRRLATIEHLFGDTQHHLKALADAGGFVGAELEPVEA